MNKIDQTEEQAAYEAEQNRLLGEVEELMGPTPEDNQGSLDSQEVPNDLSETISPEEPEQTVSTDEVVEEIVAAEGDELLAAQDEKKHEQETPRAPKKSLFQLVKSFWAHRKIRNITLITLLVILLAALLWPNSRYFLLNSAGVRVSAHFNIVDEATDKPLRNVELSIDGRKTTTNERGEAEITGLRQGKTVLKIEKRSFATIEKNVTLGWGSNHFTTFELTPTGASYSFMFTDFLSGLPLEHVEVKEGDSGAFSGADGIATLTLDPGDASTLNVSISLEDYRSENVQVPVSTKDRTSLKLAPSAKHYFMSRRSGTFEMYRIDADGANEEMVLNGTGKERDDIALSVSPKRDFVAYVSTRNGATNSDGYALQSLSIFNTSNKQLSEISQAEQIRLIGWIDTKIVFVKVVAGPSGAIAYRQKIISYNTDSGNLQDIATSDGFNDVIVIGDRIYYAPGNIYGTENDSAKFYSIKSDATDKKTLLERQTWSALRTAYDSLSLSTVGNVWYSYTIGADSAVNLTTPTATPRDKQYVDNTHGTYSAWLDYRDGKGVVVIWDIAAKTETVIYTKGGVTTPLQWLDNKHLIYRQTTNEEVADYIIAVSGGEPRKITDVAPTFIFGNGGYY